jgi:glutamine amidotransferase
MRNLRARGLEEPLREALHRGASLLGICVGFQMLFEESDEDVSESGLGFLQGRVRRFPAETLTPHIGWNQLEGIRGNGLLAGIEEGSYFYFLHSYYADPADEDVACAHTAYEVEFCSVAQKDRVAGIQFHPEKSQALGLRVLQNFLSC